MIKRCTRDCYSDRLLALFISLKIQKIGSDSEKLLNFFMVMLEALLCQSLGFEIAFL